MSNEREAVTRIQVVPLNDKGFIHGYPGVPANTTFERGATIKGEVLINLPLVGVAASSIEVKVLKTESISLQGRKPISSDTLISKHVIWEENQYRPQNVLAGRYRFSIPISEDLPPTVALDKHGIEIRYSMIATVFRANKMSWSGKPISCTQSFLLEKYENHPAWPIHHSPEAKHIDIGSIRLSARSGKSCYGPGETINLTAGVVIGTHRVTPRNVRFDVKFEEVVTVFQKSALWTGTSHKVTKRILAQQSKSCTKSDHTANVGFTAGLTIQVPKDDVKLTLTSAAHVRIVYNLVVTSEVHSEHLRLELPVTVSPWTSDAPEELQTIGPVTKLGGAAIIEKPPIYPNSEYAGSIAPKGLEDSITSRTVSNTPTPSAYTLPAYAESPILPRRADLNNPDGSPRYPFGSRSDYTESISGRTESVSGRAESVSGRARSELSFDSNLTGHDLRNVRYGLGARRTTMSSNVTMLSEDNTLEGSDYGGSSSVLFGQKTVTTPKLLPVRHLTRIDDLQLEDVLSLDEDEDESGVAQKTPRSQTPGASGKEEKEDNASINIEDYIDVLMGTLRSSEKTKALLELRGKRAQAVVDFLDLVLLELDPSMSWLRKHTLIALYRLCKASQLHPECYTLHNIKLVSQEGGGGFADIHRGRHEEEIICLKVVRMFQKTRTEEMLKLFAKEAVLWSHLHHPNILSFYGIYYLDQARQRMCLVSPWMENGNLVAYLHDNPSVSRRPFVYDVIMGLEYLHENRIVHGDLKGVNVLVTATGRACIADFGLSSVLIDKTISTTVVTSAIYGGTYRWVAPELLDDSESQPTRASDIWAFGCVCYQILTRQVPYYEILSDPAVIAKILRRGLPTRPAQATGLDSIDDEMWLLMKRCWSFSSEYRPTCRQILALLGLVGMVNRPVNDERSSSRTAEFRNAMRTSSSVQINEAVIKGVFDEINGIDDLLELN